jgi:N-acetylmuramoyl-L-alanine amidase
MIDVQVGPYYVLNTRTCPPPWSRSVFMTNYGDVNSLRDRLVLDNAARGIVSGIMTI